MASPTEENGTAPHTEAEAPSTSLARLKLENLLNKSMRVRMTDGRTLVGLFLCTDRDCNVILGSAQEFLKPSGSAASAADASATPSRRDFFNDGVRLSLPPPDSFSQGEPRVLGLAMIPGHHVVSIEVESESLLSA
ncbi:N-alpha-acetyltransferase 38, NatC auxiliary subunit isoform X1 [Scleropages formosus]|uniref:N-alpha-acetyltransferase 38, NatC auxiliary subunit isoform X1 n=1 Tax=Scleropages formosus TaxID=113540 RepID=UPI000878CDD7|nr:N-alpha-acetyltransferase 38, NatC auxiliary subunit isoform X1 [Scleropages formosus]